MPGDFRLQAHGYEYRTYPSWLDSPDLAFLTITLSKLAVQEPGLYESKKMNPFVELKRLKNFLSYFKHKDDDARLALVMLGRGLPSHKGGDFRERWGIPTQPVTYPNRVGVIPLSIKPDKESIREVFEYLRVGDGIRWRIPEYTWGPLNPPKEMSMCLGMTNTHQAKGLGEMIWDLCTSARNPFVISAGQRGSGQVTISNLAARHFPLGWRSKYPFVYEGKIAEQGITISQDFREGENVKRTREFLTSGLLPIWKVSEVRGGEYAEWEKRYKENGEKKDRNWKGNLVFGSGEWKNGPLKA